MSWELPGLRGPGSARDEILLLCWYPALSCPVAGTLAGGWGPVKWVVLMFRVCTGTMSQIFEVMFSFESKRDGERRTTHCTEDECMYVYLGWKECSRSVTWRTELTTAQRRGYGTRGEWWRGMEQRLLLWNPPFTQSCDACKVEFTQSFCV